MRTEELVRGLDLVADVLVPPTGAWPSPSALSVAADLADRLRKREIDLITIALDAVGPVDDFAQATDEERARRVAVLQSADPAVFDVLRRCVYYGYYAQPAVVRLLREQGHDINESPQPRGYRMDAFTADVVASVDRSRTVWIPAAHVGQTLRTAS